MKSLRKYAAAAAIVLGVSSFMTPELSAGPSMFTGYKKFEGWVLHQCVQRAEWMIAKSEFSSKLNKQNSSMIFVENGDYTMYFHCIHDGKFTAIYLVVAGPDEEMATRIGKVFLESF